MAELLRSTGIDAGPFTARMLRPEHLRGADLVLAMSREHRAAAVALVPAVVRRTFLLGEAGVIGAAIAADGWPGDGSPEPAARLAGPPRPAPRGPPPRGPARPGGPPPHR